MAGLIYHNAIQCAVCQHYFWSTLIEPQSQVEDLMAKLGRHYELRHREELSRNTLATKHLAGLTIMNVFLNNLAVIPEDNTTLTEYLAELQDETLKLLGFDESEEDESETEDDEDKTEQIISTLEHIRETTTDPSTAEQLATFIDTYLVPDEETPEIPVDESVKKE